MKTLLKNLLALSLLLSIWIPVLAEVGEPALQKSPDGISLRFRTGTLRLRVLSDSMVRVSFSNQPAFFAQPSLDLLPRPTPFKDWTAQKTDMGWEVRTAKIQVIVDPEGRVRFIDQAGKTILEEKEGGRTLEAAQVMGEETFHVRQRWVPQEGESLYGLGEHPDGLLNLKGYDLDLWQHNTCAAVPFLVSSKGYGLLWENTSFTRFGDLGDFLPVSPLNLYDEHNQRGGLTLRIEDPSKTVTHTPELYYDSKEPAWKVPVQNRVWDGFLESEYDGDHLFKCRFNGGVRVWIAGRLVMDHWRQSWLTGDEIAKVSLKPQERVPIRIEWNTDQGRSLRFLWKPPVTDPATSLWSEVGDGTDYVFVYGPDLNRVTAQYRDLTGAAPLMPKWAFGFWQSRNRYRAAQESLDVVGGFRARGFPLDNIVQDYLYWKPDAWGSHQFDPGRFPDPAGWIKNIHDLHAQLMVSVWGKFYPGTDNYNAMRKGGFLYPRNLKDGYEDWLKKVFTFYDAFNPGGRKLFWDQVDRDLFQKGVDAWWMDGTEPDLTSSPPDRGEQADRMNPTYLGTAARTRLAYPLENSEGVYQGQRASAPDKRVFILTRCAFLGEQRDASAVWSGDISSTWTALAKQVPEGVGYCLSGLPYWTMDVGGYSIPGKFMDPKPTKAAEDEWQELNVRWFQFGTFCPILRVHGDQRPREPWTLGGDRSQAYRTELEYARLRYRMLPYIYSTAWNVTNRGGSVMRALVLDFPGDEGARDLTDEYLFGSSFLVAPVTAYQARSRSVYLPGGTRWFDFWTGKEAAAGKRFGAKAPYDRIPLFVKAGSIVPFGPDLQYVAEKPQDPTTLYLYSGADGSFTLYEDDGVSYGYERGQSAEIPMNWDDAKGVLTLGERKGTFPGMLEKRTFRIIRAGLGHAEGYRPDAKPTTVVAYDGAEVTLAVGK